MIDLEVRNLIDIIDKLLVTRNELLATKVNLSATKEALSGEMELQDSMVKSYGRVMDDTMWLSDEAGYLSQTLRNIGGVTERIGKILWEMALAEEDEIRNNVLSLGDEARNTAPLMQGKAEELSQKMRELMKEQGAFSKEAPMSEFIAEKLIKSTDALVGYSNTLNAEVSEAIGITKSILGLLSMILT